MPLEDLVGLLTKPVEGSDAVVKDDAAPKGLVDEKTTPSSGDAGADDEALWNSLGDAEEVLADEQTGADGDGDDKSGGEDDDSQSGSDKEPFYTVTIDGKQKQVPLSEALAGYQRNEDYTRKTQEVSERRKAVDAEFETAQKVRGAYDTLLKQVQDQVEGSLNVKPEYWDKLRGENPAQFAAEWADHQRRTEAKNQIVAERERVAKEQASESTKKVQEYVAGERTKLLDKIATWKDPEKYKTGAKQVFEFAKTQYGFTDDELARAYDHRIIVMAEDARRYRALVAKAEKGKTKVDNAPIVAPRGRVPARTNQQRATEEAKQRFRRSGSVDDAVALIMTR